MVKKEILKFPHLLFGGLGADSIKQFNLFVLVTIWVVHLDIDLKQVPFSNKQLIIHLIII